MKKIAFLTSKELSEYAQENSLPGYLFHLNPLRFFCVSNDERIDIENIKYPIGKSDVLVQFNKAIHSKALNKISCRRIFSFHKNEAGYWGLDSSGQPEPHMPDISTDINFCFLTKFHANQSFENPCSNSEVPFFFVDATSLPMFILPKGKAPSAGYSFLYFLFYINFLRKMAGLLYHRIITLGFTGVYSNPNLAFSGHDFDFERRAVSFWPNVVRLDFSGAPI